MASNRSRFSRSLPFRHLGAGKNGCGAMTRPPSRFSARTCLKLRTRSRRVGHVQEQGVLALDGGLHAGDEQDAQVLRALAQVLGVDALVVAGEGEDLEALPRRLLQQLDRGVADEVVRVLAGVDVEVGLQQHRDPSSIGRPRPAAQARGVSSSHPASRGRGSRGPWRSGRSRWRAPPRRRTRAPWERTARAGMGTPRVWCHR